MSVHNFSTRAIEFTSHFATAFPEFETGGKPGSDIRDLAEKG